MTMHAMSQARSEISLPRCAAGGASCTRRPSAPGAARRFSAFEVWRFDAEEDDTAPQEPCDFLRFRFVEPEPTCLRDLRVPVEESLVDDDAALPQLFAFERPDDDVLDAFTRDQPGGVGRASVDRLP